MAAEHNVRVSDAERESVAAQLREHYAQGRLTLDELNERLDRAFSSRTRTDLNAVTFDLPYAPPSGRLPSDGVQRGFGPGGWGGRGGQGWSRRDWSGGYWSGPGPSGRGGDGGYGHGRRPSGGGFLGIFPVMLALWVCFALVSILAFGIGSGPSVVGIFLAALAAIRWILGRGRRRRGPLRAARRGRRC
jgi:hypothetical protein